MNSSAHFTAVPLTSLQELNEAFTYTVEDYRTTQLNAGRVETTLQSLTELDRLPFDPTDAPLLCQLLIKLSAYFIHALEDPNTSKPLLLRARKLSIDYALDKDTKDTIELHYACIKMLQLQKNTVQFVPRDHLFTSSQTAKEIVELSADSPAKQAFALYVLGRLHLSMGELEWTCSNPVSAFNYLDSALKLYETHFPQNSLRAKVIRHFTFLLSRNHLTVNDGYTTFINFQNNYWNQADLNADPRDLAEFYIHCGDYLLGSNRNAVDVEKNKYQIAHDEYQLAKNILKTAGNTSSLVHLEAKIARTKEKLDEQKISFGTRLQQQLSTTTYHLVKELCGARQTPHNTPSLPVIIDNDTLILESMATYLPAAIRDDSVDLNNLRRNARDFKAVEHYKVIYGCLEHGRYYTHARNNPLRAIELLNFAVKCTQAFTTDPLDIAELYYCLALAFEQLYCYAKNANDDTKAIRFKNTVLKYSSAIIEICNKTAAESDNASKRLFALTQYIEALLAFDSGEFAVAVEKTTNAQIICSKIFMAEWMTPARIRTLYARALAQTDNPLIDPLIIFKDLEEHYYTGHDINRSHDTAFFFEACADHLAVAVDDKELTIERYQRALMILRNCQGINTHHLERITKKLAPYLGVLEIAESKCTQDDRLPIDTIQLDTIEKDSPDLKKQALTCYDIATQYTLTNTNLKRALELLSFAKKVLKDIDLINVQNHIAFAYLQKYIANSQDRYKKKVVEYCKPTLKAHREPNNANLTLQEALSFSYFIRGSLELHLGRNKDALKAAEIAVSLLNENKKDDYWARTHVLYASALSASASPEKNPADVLQKVDDLFLKKTDAATQSKTRECTVSMFWACRNKMGNAASAQDVVISDLVPLLNK